MINYIVFFLSKIQNYIRTKNQYIDIMQEENLFDLSKLGMKVYDTPPKPVDMEKMLQGYELVPINLWKTLKYKTHIRYLRTDGNMKKGGYILHVEETTDSSGAPSLKFDIISGFYQNSVKWSVYSSSIDKIWKKVTNEEPDPNAALAQKCLQEIENIKDDMNYCKKSIDLIKQEIQKLSNENSRIVNLIRKLHNLK